MDKITVLADQPILLGVTGSIASYKAIDLASKLTQAGAVVDVLLTDAAQQFVTPLAFRAVTGRAVYSDLWNTETSGGLPTHIAHIGLAERAALFIIAPATAQHIAKLAHGLADDLLSLTALAIRCPLLIAPAADGHMYDHPAVVANVRTLAERGVQIIPPEMGRHASGLSGQGRLPETPTLMGAIRQAFGKQRGVLRGRQVVVTAGGTREPLDPVRYITNRSSGKQGFALAQAAVDAGADVTLISGATGLTVPYSVEYVEIESAAQMLDAVLAHSAVADALIMAAAVADYRPVTISDHKIKKTEADLTLPLARTPDILQTIGDHRLETGFPRVLVGFAAETDDLLVNAQSKLERKHADLFVANDVTAPGAGFGADTNVVTLLSREGARLALPLQSKSAIAETIITQVAGRL
ncbi:MAG: bifunctional phosphopantothenoylcysteine decarboxylase/phosphopantothenate--cysteine ligase CoaBC [Aggregatilineales bacterium]